MKPKLNKKDQSKQNKLRKMLASGLPLSALLTGLLGCTAGCVFTRTTGDVPNLNQGTFPQTKQDAKNPEPRPLMGEPLAPKPIIRGRIDPVYHEVRKGDTLRSIAKQNGMSVEQLKKLNGFSDKSASSLKVGQKIRIR